MQLSFLNQFKMLLGMVFRRLKCFLFPSHSTLVLKGLFPVGLPVQILKALIPSSILATCPAHLNPLDHTDDKYK